MSFMEKNPVSAMTNLATDVNSSVKYEQSDYTPLALDLCIRQNDRSPSPCPEGAYHDTSQQLTTPPAKQVLRMESDSSEDGSVSSDVTPYSFLDVGFGCLPAKIKGTRPFKAYPKDPFFLSVGIGAPTNVSAFAPDAILNKESAEAYADFRQRMLSQVRATNPQPGVTNPKMRRSSPQHNQTDGKDASYWEKRRKNNEAAKRSRDARRAKEDEIAIRAAFLEQENLKLKYEIAALRNETAKLRCLLYN